MSKDPALKKIPVVEVFGPTIQGEGFTAGQRTVFIRFGLCDYKCTMCDSMHAVDPALVKANARRLTQEEILTEVMSLLINTNCTSVTFSGGNPCIHALDDLVDALHNEGMAISVETQGTLMPGWVSRCDYVTVSPKGPGMGEQFEQEKFLEFIDHVSKFTEVCIKIVIFSARDLEFASMVYETTPHINEIPFYLSVGNPYFDTQTKGRVELGEDLLESFKHILDEMKGFPALRHARLLPQLHVLVWGNSLGH